MADIIFEPVLALKPLHMFCANNSVQCSSTSSDFWLGWYSSCSISDECAKQVGFPWGERHELSTSDSSIAVIQRFALRIFFFFACVATFRFIARAIILKPILDLVSNSPKHFDKLQPSHHARNFQNPQNRRLKNQLKKADNRRQRYFEAGWYALWYPVSMLLGAYVLSEEEDLVRAQSHQKLGVLDSASWWHGWPTIRQDSFTVDNFYLIQLAFNMQCLIQIVLMESRKKDYLQMVSHHIITILLIWSSYYVGLMRVGLIIITVVADGPDLFLYWAKVRCTSALSLSRLNTRTQVCHYLHGKNPLKDVFFAIFALSFYILRGIYYPLVVCMAVAIEHPSNLPEHWWFFCLLWGLYILYIFWMYLIGKMVYRLVVEKDLGGDVRCELIWSLFNHILGTAMFS
jgi:hypothetical protein